VKKPLTRVIRVAGELLNSPLTLVRKLGLKSGALQWMGHLAGQKWLTFSFPGSERRYCVNFNDEWKFIERRNWSETASMEYARKLTGRGDCIFDVGANIGQYTLLFSELVGREGKVVAFEPDPKNFQVLRSNLERNGIRNVVAEQLCVSDARGWVTLSAESLGSTLSSMVRYRQARNQTESTTVGAISLDEYCEEKGVWPDGVKIDVEGAEGLVLRGMTHLIERCRPWVMLELHGEFLSKDAVDEVWDFVHGRAKKVIYIGGDHVGHSLGEEVECDRGVESNHIRLLIHF
jgi:FkbM family methyltransferase